MLELTNRVKPGAPLTGKWAPTFFRSCRAAVVVRETPGLRRIDTMPHGERQARGVATAPSPWCLILKPSKFTVRALPPIAFRWHTDQATLEQPPSTLDSGAPVGGLARSQRCPTGQRTGDRQTWNPERTQGKQVRVMTFYEAAIEVLRTAKHPLTAREITRQARQRGLVTSNGKTPEATMLAVLYVRLRSDPDLVKLEDRGPTRAKRGSVRWALRQN